MKALILAAGLGSRLKQRTADRPKALTLICNKPILQYQLENCRELGIREIGIVVGYHGDQIVGFIRKQFPEFTAHYFWNNEFAATNSSYSFWLARNWVKGETYLHLNCDILFSDALLRHLLESPSENTITVRKDVPLGDKMENVVLEGDRIIAMSLVRKPESVAKAFGLAKFGARSTDLILQKIEERIGRGNRNEHYYGLIREAVHELDYRALDAAHDLLMEVNTLEDLDRAESFFI